MIGGCQTKGHLNQIGTSRKYSGRVVVIM